MKLDDKTQSKGQTGIDLSQAKRISSTDLLSSSKHGGGSNILSLGIVNADGNSKCIRFSKALHEALNNPNSIQVVSEGMKLVIGAKFDDDEDAVNFKFSKGKGKSIIYNASLVAWIKNEFALDYSGITSKSFQHIKIFKQDNGQPPYAVIDMSNPVN